MAEVPFAELPQKAQVNRLRQIARAAVDLYGIEVAALRLLDHGYNATFRVDAADGRRFALRLNLNPRKSRAMLLAESSWLAALRRDTDLLLPVPVPTLSGDLAGEIFSEAMGRALPVAMFGWLRGPNLGRDVTPDEMFEVGRITATLHAHSEHWSLPPGAELAAIDTVLMNEPDRLGDPHPELTPERRAVFRAAMERCQQAYDELFAVLPRQVLHADIHLHNLKRFRGSVALFDFDDCGIGVAPQDLAITAYYLRSFVGMEDRLLAGYESVRPLPPCTPEQFEAVVASRNLVLVNDLLATEHAGIRELVPRYMADSEIKQRHFLETGEFRHDAGGVQPIGW